MQTLTPPIIKVAEVDLTKVDTERPPVPVQQGNSAHVRTNNATQNHGPGPEAQGYALAESAKAENMGQLQARGVWNRYVAKLIDLSPEARQFFITYLTKDHKERRAHVDAKKGTEEHALYKSANQSAGVMLSNLQTIAKAMNLGLSVAVIEEDGRQKRDAQGNLIPVEPFTSVLARARLHIKAQGQGTTKGRKPLPFAQKLAQFLNSCQIATDTDKELFEKLVADAQEMHLVKVDEAGDIVADEAALPKEEKAS